jgi:hypothetical protein
MRVLPPLLQDLQPLGRGFLIVTDDALKFAGAMTRSRDATADFNKKISDPKSTNFFARSLGDVETQVARLGGFFSGSAKWSK